MGIDVVCFVRREGAPSPVPRALLDGDDILLVTPKPIPLSPMTAVTSSAATTSTATCAAVLANDLTM